MKTQLTVALTGNPNPHNNVLLNTLNKTCCGTFHSSTINTSQNNLSFTYKDKKIHLINLPEIYNLSTVSQGVTKDYIIKENPDIILNLVDACNLERNLYLTLQLLELKRPLIMVLNMMDLAESKGININVLALSNLLDIPIIPITNYQQTGINYLLNSMINPINLTRQSIYEIKYEKDVLAELNHILTFIKKPSQNIPAPWVALRILEGDKFVLNYLSPKDRQCILNYLTDVDLSLTTESIIASKYTHITQIIMHTVTFSHSTRTSIIEDISSSLVKYFSKFTLKN